VKTISTIPFLHSPTKGAKWNCIYPEKAIRLFCRSPIRGPLEVKVRRKVIPSPTMRREMQMKLWTMQIAYEEGLLSTRKEMRNRAKKAKVRAS